MINQDKLAKIIAEYKKDFPNRWPDERYKWEAVKCFQDNWDINASDFVEMFAKATEKTGNLLASSRFYPYAVIYDFAKKEPETLRSMFTNLYNETRPLEDRIEEFQKTSDSLREKFSSVDHLIGNHYQNDNVISTYLWLRYPDKYYIYKYSEYKEVIKILSSDTIFKKGKKANISIGFNLYDEICGFLNKDTELRNMLKQVMTDDCYPDDLLKTLTIDVGFYISRKEIESDDWFPRDYSPNLTITDWQNLLDNPNIFYKEDLEIMKRFKDMGDAATCLQLAKKYGEIAQTYNIRSTKLAKRIAKHTKCPIPYGENDNSKWWPILYLGKDADKNDEGTYVWKLRDELSKALDKIDLSSISLYAKSEEDTKMKQMKNIPLNQILYGPPGTGKTYNTVIKAMEIITFEELFRDWFLKIYCLNNDVASKEKVLNDYISSLIKINDEHLVSKSIFQFYELQEYLKAKNEILNSDYIQKDPVKNNKNSYYQHSLRRYEEFLEWLSQDRYDKIKEKFEEYKSLGRIEFITFHQSYSYEEFVEGIKPEVSGDTKEIEYNVKPGIFRTICEKASTPTVLQNKWNIDSDVSIWKVSLGGTYDNPIRKDCFENNRIRIGWDAYGENYEDKATEGKRSLDAFYQKMKKGDIVLSCYTNRIIDGIGIIEGDPVFDSSLSEYKRTRKVNWIVKNIKEDIFNINDGTTMTLSAVYKLKIPLNKIVEILHKYNAQAPVTQENDKKFVLIIDEINRGNISKIFGELITLIEEDKRSNLSVRLPYSAQLFTVPKNLYIIGTMNTADRSIAAIDIALRRRFTFIPKMPNVNLVPNKFNMKEAFENLNKKIRILLDEDHQIGHSYFMNIETILDLKETWANKIIPLLNEYFYGDWTKLKLLIPGFVSENPIKDKELEDEIGENCYYSFKNPNNDEDFINDDDFIKATMGLKI